MFQDAISDFWEWFGSTREEIAAELATGGLSDDSIADIEEAVWRIHPELNWQVTAGLIAPHSLNFATGGTRLLRLVAELWVRMGPGNDASWEHYPARLPFGLTPFEMHGLMIDPAESRFVADEDTTYERLNLTMSHPVFNELDDDSATEAAMHILDATLGEDAVEGWLGYLETTDELDDGAPLFSLPALIERFAATCDGQGWEDVADQYDGVVRATTNRAVKWIDNLNKPIYGEITIPALATDADGLPAPLEQRRLDTLIADLLTRLGPRAVLLGMAVGDGEQTLHLYLDPTEETGELIEAWRTENDNRDISMDLEPDEQWQNAEQWD